MTTPAEPAHKQQTWTTRGLLDWMRSAFERREIDAPRLSAEMLLAHTLDCERMHLYAHAERPASPHELASLRALVERAIEHEPIQYLVGEAWFFSYPFTVDRRALIPRPSTETILEHALQWLRAQPSTGTVRIADIGTGTGCIAIAALKSLADATCLATDLSPDALSLARENATRHGVLDRITFAEGNLDAPLADEPPFQLIMSNPPYIPDHEWDDVEPNVKDHEPTSALRAGPTGLELVGPLIEQLPNHLTPDGRLCIELAACTADEARRLAEAHPLLEHAEILKDLDGLPRVLTALRRR